MRIRRYVPWVELVFALLLLFMLGAWAAVYADDGQVLKPVVEARAPISKRVLFVLDRSGSMENWKFEDGVAAVFSILSQGTDDMQFGVIAFNEGFDRWPGIPEDGVPKGWAALPSETALKEVKSYLTSLQAKGNTLVLPAMTAALKDDVKDMTVVLVTDGAFLCENLGRAMTTIRGLQEARKNGSARIFVLGVNVSYGGSFLKLVAETFDGGYYLMRGSYTDPPPPPVQIGPHEWEGLPW